MGLQSKILAQMEETGALADTSVPVRAISAYPAKGLLLILTLEDAFGSLL